MRYATTLKRDRSGANECEFLATLLKEAYCHSACCLTYGRIAGRWPCAYTRERIIEVWAQATCTLSHVKWTAALLPCQPLRRCSASLFVPTPWYSGWTRLPYHDTLCTCWRWRWNTPCLPCCSDNRLQCLGWSELFTLKSVRDAPRFLSIRRWSDRDTVCPITPCNSLIKSLYCIPSCASLRFVIQTPIHMSLGRTLWSISGTGDYGTAQVCAC